MPTPTTGQDKPREKRGDMIENLYYALEQYGVVSKGIDNFRSYLQTEDNCKTLYDALKSGGAIASPDFETFKEKLGVSYSGDATLSRIQSSANKSENDTQKQGTPSYARGAESVEDGSAGNGINLSENWEKGAAQPPQHYATQSAPPLLTSTLMHQDKEDEAHATVVADRKVGKQVTGYGDNGEIFTQRVENQNTGRGLYFNNSTDDMRASMEDWQRLDGFVTPEAQRIKDAAMQDDPFVFHDTFIDVWQHTDNDDFFKELESRGFPMDVQQPKSREQLIEDADKWLSNFKRYHNASEDAINERLRNRDAFYAKHGMTSPRETVFGMGSSVQIGGDYVKKYNPATQQVEVAYTPIYTNETGKRYMNRASADLDQWRAEYQRWASKNPIIAQLEEAYSERRRLEKEMYKRRVELSKAYIPTGTAAVSPEQNDVEYKKLQAAANKNDARIQTLENARESEERGFWSGFFHEMTDLNNWLFGLPSFSDAAILYGIKNKLDNGETISATERSVLDSTMKAMQAEEQYGDETGSLYNYGRISGASLHFIKDILLTDGMGSLAKAGAKYGARAAAKYASSSFGKEVLDVTGSLIGKNFLKNTGIALGDMAASMAMTGTIGVAHTAADALNRNVGAVTFDDDGNYTFVGGEKFLKSIYKSGTSRTLEYYTEKFGEHLGLGKWMSEVAENFGLSRMSKAINYLSNSKWLEKGGIQDFPSEVLEEEANILLNALLVGDNKFSDFVDGKTQGDIWGGMLFSIGLMKSAEAGLRTAGYYVHKRSVNKASNKASQILGARWQSLRDEIDGASNEEMGSLVKKISSDKDLTLEQRESTLNYAKELLIMRGYNMALLNDFKGRIDSDGGVSSLSDNVDDAYGAGYQAEGTERPDVKNRLDVAENRVRSFASDEDMQYLGGNPVESLKYIDSVGGWSDEQRQAAIDYVNAKSAYDGMLQRVRDDIEEKVSASDSAIDGSKHKDGMLHPATLKDGHEEIYIVSGDVVQLDGGEIDVDKTSDSLIVYDPKTGEEKFVSPKDLESVGELVSPKQARETASSQIREELVQSAVNEINDVLPFNQGDVYDGLLDEDGQMHTVQIVGEVPETNGEQVYVFFDGSAGQKAMPKSVLQDWRYAANLSRISPPGNSPLATSGSEAADSPLYKYDDVVLLQTEDGAVNGVVINEDKGDGLITIQTERPINGKLVNSFTREELDAMTSAKTEDALVEGEVKDDAAQSTGDDTDAEIQPVGKSVLGSLFDQFRGRAKDAVKFLLNRKEGSAVGALHHKDVGDIDLWYGNEQAGLLKIAEKHPEVLEDLQGIIDGMHVVQASENRVILESDTHKAVVSKDWYGKKIDNWLLTAYEKKNGASGGSIDIVPEPSGMQNGTAPLQDTSLSAGKGSVDSANEQEKVAEDADAMPMVVVDGREKPDFSRATPERAHAYVYNERGLSRENADAFVENNINASALELEALRSEKPEMGTDLDEFDEAMSSWQFKIDAARRKHDYWQSVKDVQSGIVAAGAELQRRRDIAASEEGAQVVEQAGTGVSGEQERGAVQQGERGSLDSQGNELDAHGRIVTERVSSVSELTDADFTQPVRSVELDGVPAVVREAIGAGEKPVVIKKNIFEKNARDHGDLTPEQSREILNAALYDADLYGRNKPASKPYNWVVINTKDAEGKNRLVLLEVNENKDNVEVVHWHYLDNRGLDKIKRQAAREGGQILMLPSEEEAGALSSRTHGLSSAGKGSVDSANEQGSVEKSEDAGSSLAVSGRDGGRRAESNITEQPIVTSDAESNITETPVSVSPTERETNEIDVVDGEANDMRNEKAVDGSPAPDGVDIALRDALIDKLREMGIDVIVDEGEAQRVLDAANGGVTLSKGQKRALETVSASQREKHLQTVVSSADGAKVLQNLRNLVDEIENLQQSPVKTFIGDVAKAIGAQKGNRKSQYATFEAKNGNVVTIRISDHNATVSNFDNHNEHGGISIVISPKKNTGLNNDGNAHVVEFYYDAIKLRRSAGKPLASIVRSIEQALYSGEYKDTTGLAEREEVNLGDVRLQMAAPVFYSNALRAVEGVRQDKATPAQWLAMIQKQGGLKAGEDKWIGLSEWLNEQEAAGKKSLTKQEVLDFIRENQIEIEEVDYTSQAKDFDELSDEYDAWVRSGGKEYAWNRLVELFGDDANRAFTDNGAGLEIADEGAASVFLDNGNPINSERLKYTTAGLEDKREIALVVPTVEPYKEHDGVHFGDAGGGRAVAWVRFGETTDADGKRVLVIDEIQSKRHQEGREKGYKGNKDTAKRKQEVLSAIEDLKNRTNYRIVGYFKNEDDLKEWELLNGELQSIANKEGIGIPDAPFEKSWMELAMKRMLRYAAENGYDKVAWTTGAQQADRYDLTKVIEEIAYWKEGENYAISAGDKRNTQKIDQETFTPQELVETFGREIADKIINDEGSFDSILGYPEDSDVHYLNDETIKVGGEGMKVFYDQMLPRFMDKYGKKWGVKTYDVELPEVEEAGRVMHAVDVTPDMKASVMEGQPMFFRTANGVAYGFTFDGKIYIDPRIATSETPIHEYAHLWAQALRNVNNESWQHVVGLMKESGVWDWVKSLYPELRSDDALAEEVLAHYSGKRGAERLRAAMDKEMGEAKGVLSKAKIVSAFSRLKDAIKRFWSSLADFLHVHYNSADEVADRVIADLLDGVNPLTIDRSPLTSERSSWLDAEYMHLVDIVEKPRRIEKLRNSKPVEITGNEITPSEDLKEYKKNALEYGKKLQGSYTNADTGNVIQLQRGRKNGGLKEILSHDINDEAHIKSVAAIPQIIEKAIYIDSAENADKSKNSDVVRYNYYVCGLKIGGDNYTVRMVEAEQEDGSRYYDHKLTQIEKTNLLDRIDEISSSFSDKEAVISSSTELSSTLGSGAANQNRPTNRGNTLEAPVFVGKDKRLLQILQVNPQEIAEAEERMREILDEVKAERVYVSESDFRMSHAAPNGSDGYSKSIANPDGIYPEDLYSPQGYRYYGDGDVTMDMASADIFKRLRGNPDALVKVYRAVPDSLHETGIRNGDWVSINRRYAQEHGERHIDGGFKILEEEVPAKFVYTDDNSLHEQGYDDGKGYAYKDVANNRKLDDLITRDDSGRLILPSERFNEGNSDVRYHRAVGGNRGYVGYSMSKGAARAREEGRFPKTDFKKEYGVTEKALQALVNAGIVENGEWHHTSMYGNKTVFYGWSEPWMADAYAEKKKAVDEIARKWNRENWQWNGDFYKEINDLFDGSESKVSFEEREQKKKDFRAYSYRLNEQYNNFIKENYAINDEYDLGNGLVVKTNGSDFYYSWDVYKDGERLSKRRGGNLRDKARSLLKERLKNKPTFTEWLSEKGLLDEYQQRRDAAYGGGSSLYRDGKDGVESGIKFHKADVGQNSNDLDAVNERFNEELSRLTEENKDSVSLSLGRPSSILLAAGVENKPMKLYGNKVLSKMKKHGFTLDELRDLPMAVADPIAVFDNYQQLGNRTILTGLRSQGKNIMVAVTLGKDGVDVDFNIVSSVFGKGDSNIVDWIKKGYLRYVNKGKALDYLHFSESGISEASNNQELISAAKVVEDFENPKLFVENRSDSDVESVMRELSGRYNGKEMVFIDLGASDDVLWEQFADIRELLDIGDGDMSPAEFAKEMREELKDTLGSFVSETGKIYIFAANIPAHRIEEAYFHENIHAQLYGKYGDGISESDIVNHFRENAPASGGLVERSFIERKYEVAKQKEEFFATWLGKAMVRGEVEDMVSLLPDESDRATVYEILNKIGYDTRKESVERASSQDNQGGVEETPKGTHEEILGDRASVGLDGGRGGEVAGDGIVSPDGGDVSDVRGASDSDFAPRDRAIARDSYERMVSTGGYAFQEAVQDSMLGLKRFYQAVLGKDTLIEDVPGFENAYLAENRMSSVTAAEQYEFYVRFMKPLLSAIGKLVGTSESARVELIDYMMAKHGLERNEVMARRDFEAYVKKYPSGTKTFDKFRSRDYAGLTALTGKEDVSAAEAAAREMVSSYEQSHDTTDLWRCVNNATSATLNKVYVSGLLSKERYEEIQRMYSYYIPLQGWDETTSDQEYGYITSNRGIFGGTPIRRAKGRSSKADDPIATIALMADRSIQQGNRNAMKGAFLNFVLNHPSDLASVSDLWLRYDELKDEWEPVFADIDKNDSSSEISRKIQDFEQRMESLSASAPDRYKRGSDAQAIPYKVVNGNLKEHQVLVRRSGRTYVITINGNPRAAQALNGLTNPNVETGGVVGNLLKGAEWINHNLSALYTTRNPEFVLSNFFRDMLYSNCMVWVKESPRYAIKFHGNVGRVNPVMMRKLLGKWHTDTLDDSVPLERLFRLFMQNGGETGYTNVKNIEEHKQAISSELKRNSSSVRQAWSWLGDQFDILNGAIENTARFAAFKTSMEMGRGIERSIYDAKEISVNFNKKGSGGKMLGSKGQENPFFALLFNPKTYFDPSKRTELLAQSGSYISGGGRLLYVFWNAGVQGMTNFGRSSKRHPLKAFAGAASMFALGAVIPLLAKLFGGGDGDDDDKNAYYNLPEYIRRSNIVIKAGNQWVTIPLPIEFRAFYGLGELATGVITHNERYSDEELAFQIASQLSQLLPLDMLEGGGGFTPFIPSAAKPFIEAYVLNRSWSGLPIYKESPWNKYDPEWKKAYKKSNTYLVSGARWLNEITGGDDYRKGLVDINPAKVEYLFGGMFGGAFTTVDKLVKMAETAFGDREFEWRNMLLASRVIKSGDERTEFRHLQNEYFKYKDFYEETKALLKNYENDAVVDEKYKRRLEELKASKDYLVYEVFDNYAPIFDALRDAKKGSDASTGLRLESEENVLRREMVNLVHAIEDDKNPDIESSIDNMLDREFASKDFTSKPAAKVIASRLGGKDSYGSPNKEYGKRYLVLRDRFDLAEDVVLQSAEARAKKSGDYERASKIGKMRKKITTIKQGLGKGDANSDEKVMKNLREYRKTVLKELGLTDSE